MAPKRSREIEHRIIACVASGLNQRETARQLGIHFNTVNRVLKDSRIQKIMATADPEVHSDVARKTEEIIHQQAVQTMTHMANVIEAKTEEVVQTLQEQFDNVAQDAFDKLQELMATAESEGIQLKSAESILDRSSLSPKRQIHSKVDVQQNVVVLHATAAWLEEAKAAMLEVGVDASTLLPINPDGETITLDRDTGKMVSFTPPHDPIDIP